MVQKLLQVGLPVPTRRVFDYLPPPQGSHLPQAGVRVRVPFGRGKRIGIVTGVANESSVAPERLRPAIEILDHSPLLDRTHIEFLQWAAASGSATARPSLAFNTPSLAHHPPGKRCTG